MDKQQNKPTVEAQQARIAQEGKAKKEPKFAHSPELKAHATAELLKIAQAFDDLSTRFLADKWEECSGYYQKQAAKARSMAAWYDEEGKKKAEIARLKAALAKLEAEEAAAAK